MTDIALPDLDAMIALTARFETAQLDDPALAEAQLDSIIRHVPGKRAILRGSFHGRAAVFRVFDDPTSRQPGREWAEMTRIWPVMQDGDLRVAEPLHYNAVHGVIVMQDVIGTPLLMHLYALEEEERSGYMQAPAQLLRKYTAQSETLWPSKAKNWLDRAEAESAKQTHGRLQRRERKLIKLLRRLLKASHEQQWRHAICHGDYHPNNLILDTPRLTAIDLGGSASLPIYKDITRFLMHMGRRGMIPSGQSRFGVDLEGLNAFTHVFELSDWEQEIVLPFMLGVEALIRVEGPNMSRSRIRRAADMYDLLIADLRQL